MAQLGNERSVCSETTARYLIEFQKEKEEIRADGKRSNSLPSNWPHWASFQPARDGGREDGRNCLSSHFHSVFETVLHGWQMTHVCLLFFLKKVKLVKRSIGRATFMGTRHKSQHTSQGNFSTEEICKGILQVGKSGPMTQCPGNKHFNHFLVWLWTKDRSNQSRWRPRYLIIVVVFYEVRVNFTVPNMFLFHFNDYRH